VLPARSSPSGAHMRNIHRICHFLTRLTRRGRILPVHATGEAAMLAATQHRPPGRSNYPPLLAQARTMLTHKLRGGARRPAPHGKQRTMIEPGLLPRTLQLCIHCQDNPRQLLGQPRQRQGGVPAMVPALLPGTGPGPLRRDPDRWLKRMPRPTRHGGSDAGRLALAGVPGRVSRADRDTRTAGHVEDGRLVPS
jgi:hypothetical protein